MVFIYQSLTLNLFLSTYLMGADGEITASLITAQFRTVTCFEADRVNKNEFFICAYNSVEKFNLNDRSFRNVAGVSGENGYADGVGDQARFNEIKDILQMDSSTIIVADHVNHCLREIIRRTTSTFAGNCTESDFTDGSFENARFSGPNSMLRMNATIYLAEWGNSRIRYISLTKRTVATYVHLKNPEGLVSIACFGECRMLYFTVRHAVVSVNRLTHGVELVVGSLSINLPGQGPFNHTRFEVPKEIVMLNERQMCIADRDHNRVLLLDLQSETSTVIAQALKPWSLQIQGNYLLIGTHSSGIFSVNITHIINSVSTMQPATIRPATQLVTDTTDSRASSETNRQSTGNSTTATGISTNVLLAIILSIVAVALIVAVSVTICVVKGRRARHSERTLQQNPAYNGENENIPPYPAPIPGGTNRGSSWKSTSDRVRKTSVDPIYASIDIDPGIPPPDYSEYYLNPNR